MAALGQRARGLLAERLKELRNAAGLNQKPLAERLGWGQPKVSRLESGGQIPSAGDLAAWAAATGADLEELTRLRQRALAEQRAFSEVFSRPGGAALQQDEIAAAEAAARRVAFWYPLIVPGILQTADYAREMLHLDGGPAAYGSSDDDISRMIAIRLRRQAVLHEPGRQVTVLTGEAALRSRVASPQTMRAQCEHIASLAASLATAMIGIVPFSAQLPFASVSSWSVIDDVVIVEGDDRNTEIADPAEVERYWRYAKALLSVAVTGAEAAALCRGIAAGMEPDA